MLPLLTTVLTLNTHLGAMLVSWKYCNAGQGQNKIRLFTFNYWNFVQSKTTLSGSLISSKLLQFSHEIHIDWMTLQRSTTEVATKWNSCMVLSANMKKMMVLLQLTSQNVQLKVPLPPNSLAGLDSNSICIVAGHLQQALHWSEVATARSFTLKEALWLT